MKIISFLLIIQTFFLFGCKKEDPNPHLKDPIYLDLVAQEQAFAAEVTAAEKALIETKSDIGKAKPQTGELKRAEKKFFAAETQLARLRQEHSSLIVRKQTRILESKESYQKAFAEGKEWPNPSEYDNYLAAEGLRKTEKQWNVPARIEKTK